MNDLLILAVIGGSVGFMFWYVQRRHWNAAGEDDRIREEE